jgi:hypothetical protein
MTDENDLLGSPPGVNDLLSRAIASANKPRAAPPPKTPSPSSSPSSSPPPTVGEEAAAKPPTPKPAAAPAPTPAQITDILPQIDDIPEVIDKQLKSLQKDLFKLGKKAVKKLHKLLDAPDAKTRLQASSIATRSALLALAKDTLASGGGAEIHIHTAGIVQQFSGQPAQPGQPAGQVEEIRGPHPRTGKPQQIVK